MTSLFLNGVPLRGSILIISGGNKFICLRCQEHSNPVVDPLSSLQLWQCRCQSTQSRWVAHHVYHLPPPGSCQLVGRRDITSFTWYWHKITLCVGPYHGRCQCHYFGMFTDNEPSLYHSLPHLYCHLYTKSTKLTPNSCSSHKSTHGDAYIWLSVTIWPSTLLVVLSFWAYHWATATDDQQSQIRQALQFYGPLFLLICLQVRWKQLCSIHSLKWQNSNVGLRELIAQCPNLKLFSQWCSIF